MEEQVAHILDPVDFVLGIDSCLGQSIAHASRLANAIWDSIHKTKLGWQVVLLVRYLDLEERLVEYSHIFLVDLLEVLSNLGLLIIKNKTVIDWIFLEVDIVDDIGPLAAPISNHRFVAELKADNLLELRLTV